MDRPEVFVRLRTVAVELLDVSIDDFVSNASLRTDLGLDSLDLAEYCLAVEDEFDVRLPEAELHACTNIAEFTDLVVAQTTAST